MKLHQNAMPLSAAGFFTSNKIMSILLAVVLVLAVILVAIIIIEVVAGKKKKKSGGKNPGVDDEWVRDVVQEITATEEGKAAEFAKENPSEETAKTATDEAPVRKNSKTSRTNRHSVVSMRHIIVELSDDDESGIVKRILDKITIKDQESGRLAVLDDVSLDIAKGEIIGIVGTDGSGKSTLLKLISGDVEPTDGDITVNSGNVHFLSVEGSNDYDVTGRKYLYKCAEDIGYSKQYVDRNYDDIVRFAELREFMDEKIRNFSAGMLSRLKFAIAAVDDEPGILIIDELLSVCDVFFRKKCENKMHEMSENGTTIVIVSNVMNFVARNCTRAAWIEKGSLKMTGEPEKVCSAYIHMQYIDK